MGNEFYYHVKVYCNENSRISGSSIESCGKDLMLIESNWSQVCTMNTNFNLTGRNLLRERQFSNFNSKMFVFDVHKSTKK